MTEITKEGSFAIFCWRFSCAFNKCYPLDDIYPKYDETRFSYI